jgi:hypothetical protein
MTSKHTSQQSRKRKNQPLCRFFVCGIGIGCTGAVCAWVNRDSQGKWVRIMQGLSEREAEFHSMLAALESVPDASRVQIYCSSPSLCYRFDECRSVSGYPSQALLVRLRRIIHARRLEVSLHEIPRAQNPAARLADRHQRQDLENATWDQFFTKK